MFFQDFGIAAIMRQPRISWSAGAKFRTNESTLCQTAFLRKENRYRLYNPRLVWVEPAVGSLKDALE